MTYIVPLTPFIVIVTKAQGHGHSGTAEQSMKSGSGA